MPDLRAFIVTYPARERRFYAPAMDRARKGELPWTKEFHPDTLSEEEKNHWSLVWLRLKPWPDAVPGLAPQEEVHHRAVLDLADKLGA